MKGSLFLYLLIPNLFRDVGWYLIVHSSGQGGRAAVVELVVCCCWWTAPLLLAGVNEPPDGAAEAERGPVLEQRGLHHPLVVHHHLRPGAARGHCTHTQHEG